MKDIWKQFIETLKTSAKASWKEIKKIAKSTFDVFKNALIDFVEAIGVWLWSLIEGVAVIVYNLIKVVGSALLTAIKLTLGVAIDWIISKIKKF